MRMLRKDHPERYKSANIIKMEQCRDIVIRDIALLDGSNWACHVLASERVLLSGLCVVNPTDNGSDGFDVDGSSGVRS